MGSNLCIGLAHRSLSSSGPVAQRLEQETHNFLVGGSNPSGSINQQQSNYPGPTTE